jgi:hypothetical protein
MVLGSFHQDISLYVIDMFLPPSFLGMSKGFAAIPASLLIYQYLFGFYQPQCSNSTERLTTRDFLNSSEGCPPTPPHHRNLGYELFARFP